VGCLWQTRVLGYRLLPSLTQMPGLTLGFSNALLRFVNDLRRQLLSTFQTV
jgi:hypothetical protein